MKATLELDGYEYEQFVLFKNTNPYAILYIEGRYGENKKIELIKKDKVIEATLSELQSYKNALNESHSQNDELRKEIQELKTKHKKSKLSWLNPF